MASIETSSAKLTVAAGAAAVFCVALVIGILARTLGGILGIWIVGWFFPDTLRDFFNHIGLAHFALWQIGAMFGFVSGFLVTKVSLKNDR